MRTFLKSTFLFIFSLLVFINAQAQSEETPIERGYDLGIELQAYPTGIIPGFRFENYFNEKNSFNIRVGYQLIDHRDLGVQDNEEGSGFGFSLGYRRFFKYNHEGFSLGLRADVWWNTIDWETGTEIGETNITVLQPTALAEYAFRTDSNIVITPSLGFGFEWNVRTDGEPTGEGAILLLGCTFGFGL